ncbi:hypothetical protein [Streptomyces sp. NPDC059893]|uniref:hypothetical protein n=1 Tax=Streptomyces sp. NPDC059893 TaxID=3346990 RepID=UPI00364DC9B8
MDQHDQDQGDVLEPVSPPLPAEQAREVTAGLREAMGDVRRSVAVLAARSGSPSATAAGPPTVRRSSASPAQAYRLLDVARSLAAIHRAVTAGADLSRTRDTNPAAAALDYGLSQRVLIDVASRAETVAELITRRLATLARSGQPDGLDELTVRAVVRQAARGDDRGG